MTLQNEAVVSLTVQEDGVAVVRIHRPEAKNALNTEVRQRLADTFRELARRARAFGKGMYREPRPPASAPCCGWPRPWP